MSLRHALAVVVLVATPVSAAPFAPRAHQSEGGALPYELAFNGREFLWDEPPAVAPDGGMVAYTVRQRPADLSLDARYQPDGTPSSVVGGRIFVSKAGGGDAIEICPREGSCWRPSWSPDASLIAFFSNAGGFPQLWVHDLADGSQRRVSEARLKPKLWFGDQARWSPDGATLYVPLSPDPTGGPTADEAAAIAARSSDDAATAGATVTVLRTRADEGDSNADPSAARQSFMTQENNATLAAIDLATGALRELVPAQSEPRPSVLRVSPSGRWISYLSVFKAAGVTSQVSTMDLALVASAGGPVVTLARDLPLGRDYHGANYRWHPTRDVLVYLQNGRLFRVDVGADGPGEARRLGADLADLAPVPLLFSADASAVIVGTEVVDRHDYQEGQPQGLARVPLDGSMPSSVTFGEEWRYLQILSPDARRAWEPVAETLTATLRHTTTGETAAIRFHPDGATTTLWRGVGRLGGFGGDSSDGSLFATYQDIGTPPDIVRFDADLSAPTPVSEIDPRLESVARPSAEIFETRAPLHEGTLGNVRTAVILPAGAQRGDRLPGVVMLYPGGDVTRDVERFGGGSTVSLPTLTFVSRGYAVVLVNLQLGPNAEAGNPQQEMIDVLLPQVYRAAELGYVDIERLGIIGQSFGGYGTASIISRTNLFRAAVAISGIYDLAGTYGHLGDGYSGFWVGWSEGGQARMGTHPWANLRRYIDNSPYYRADLIRTPLLIVHGDQDSAYHDAEKLFTALRRLDRPAELAIYHGQGHVVSDWSLPNAVDAARRMVGFFDQHLGRER